MKNKVEFRIFNGRSLTKVLNRVYVDLMNKAERKNKFTDFRSKIKKGDGYCTKE